MCDLWCGRVCVDEFVAVGVGWVWLLGVEKKVNKSDAAPSSYEVPKKKTEGHMCMNVCICVCVSVCVCIYLYKYIYICICIT